MKEVRTEVQIKATDQHVWNILTDFSKYNEWNPFIRKIDGRAKTGEQIRIEIQTPAGMKRTYEPKIIEVKEGRELRWLGKSLFPGFLNAEHAFLIEPIEPKLVRFVHFEIFHGLLASFFGKSMDRDIKQGFEQMNKALKERAEARSQE